MDELKQAYIKKLSMVLSMENLIVEHLPMMIGKATNDKLKAGLSEHLEETREHVTRVEKILATHGGASGESDDAFKMMLEQAGKEIGMIKDKDVRDAVIIAAAQSVEHLEMAKYGTLVEWSKELDDSDAKSMLKDTLGEEEVADKKLSGIAEGGLFTSGVNEKAAE